MSRDLEDPKCITALVTGAIYTIWIQVIAIRAGNPSELWWWLLEIPILLWIVAPVLAGCLLSIRDWFSTSGMIVIAGYSLYIYEADMFGPGARSTSALIFIFLPVYQWVAVVLLLGAGAVLRRLVK